MEIQSAIKKVMAGEHLLGSEMHAVMQLIMTGQCTDSQIGGVSAIESTGPDVWDLDALFIDPDFVGSGLGKALFS